MRRRFPDTASDVYTAPVMILPGQTVMAAAAKPGFQPAYRSAFYPALATILEIHVQRVTGGGWALSWKTESGQRYKVQISVDLRTWNDATAWMAANGANNTWPIPLASPAFFRVAQEAP